MYRSNVRMGNWNENIFLAEEKMRLYESKRDRGELLIQKLSTTLTYLSREIELSAPSDFVTFGSCIQLVAPLDSVDPPSRESRNEERRGVVLAGSINEQEVDKVQRLTDGSRLVCTSMRSPCVRNAFVIKSPDEHVRDGEPLSYGQHFVLQLADSTGGTLFARAETPLVDGPHGPMDHIPVTLSNVSDCYRRWRVLCRDSNFRLETNGVPFAPMTRVVISHAMTGQCLAVERGARHASLFGTEYGVSVHTYADIRKRETSECIWMFATKEMTCERKKTIHANRRDDSIVRG